MDLRGKLPIETFQHLINKEGNFLYDGTGSLITNLNLTTSYAIYQVSWEESSSFASASVSSSYLKNPNITINELGYIRTNGQITASSVSASYLSVENFSLSNVSASGVSASLYTGNQYGSMYLHNMDVVVTVAAVDTYYKINQGFTSSFTNGFTLNNQMLTCSVSGIYNVWWDLSLSSVTNNQEIEATVFINNTQSYYTASSAHSQTFNANVPSHVSGNGILRLTSSQAVGLVVENHTGANNIVIAHGNMTLTRLGS